MSEGGFVIGPELRKLIVDAGNADLAGRHEPFGQVFSDRIVESLSVALRPQTEKLNRLLAELTTTTTKPLQDALRQIAESTSVSGILTRHQDAMAAIASRTWPVLTLPELEEARASLRRNLPETPEQIEEAGQRAATVAADPEQKKLIERITSTLKHADLSKVGLLAIPVVLYWWLCSVLGLPLDGHIAASQHADFLGVMTIVFMVTFYLWPRS
jgi:hypothetical protein